ncbi:MAG: hypothetical protein ACK53C_02065, partial [Pseudomonadota bacterium]
MPSSPVPAAGPDAGDPAAATEPPVAQEGVAAWRGPGPLLLGGELGVVRLAWGLGGPAGGRVVAALGGF